MYRITYSTYSEVLKKEFTDQKEVKSLDDWNLYNLALFHGRAIILKTEEIKA